MRFPECNNFVKNVKYIPIDKEILSGFIRSYSKEEIDYMLTIADEGAREKIKYILAVSVDSVMRRIKTSFFKGELEEQINNLSFNEADYLIKNPDLLFFDKDHITALLKKRRDDLLGQADAKIVPFKRER